ncbi:MAG: amino acid adenylation domain-containing protein [Gemmatimonadota bacterium]
MSESPSRIADLSPEKQALLALRLRERRSREAADRSIPRRSDPDVRPLSFAQQRMWFLNQWDPLSPAYNISALLRLSGPCDLEALQSALAVATRRHEVLRARFPTTAGRPTQVVETDPGFRLVLQDLTGLPEQEREAEALRRATEAARRPFDLAEGPVMRASVLRLGPEDHFLMLAIHHIVADGWSTEVLVREIADAYEALVAGRDPPAAELPIQYADYAAWQRDVLTSEVVGVEVDYWRGQLEGLPPLLELPTDRPRPPALSYAGEHVAFALPAGVEQRARELAREERATLFHVLLAAWAAILSRYSGQTRVPIGVPVANRDRPETEALVGLFVNTLVIDVELTGGPTFRELLRRVRETVIEAQEHAGVPFEMLVEELRPRRSPDHTPLFQVMFALQETTVDRLEMGGLRASLMDHESGTSRTDLTLFVERRATGLRGVLEYGTELFDRATIEQIGRHYGAMLGAVLENADRQVYGVPLLSPEEEILLEEWNATESDYPRNGLIHEIFEEQARARPEAVAVECGADRLTYRELDARAGSLASRLRQLGVTADVPVGILMERSVDLIVAHLGVLKAGGAYVPFDPRYPADRLRMMIEDCRLDILLVDPALAGLVADPGLRRLSPGPDWAPSPGPVPGPTARPAEPSAGSLAYVMYTSGSTGTPKGVCVTHRNVLRLVKGVDYVELGPDQTLLQFGPVSFDAATFEIWGALLTGGRLVVYPPGEVSFAELGRTLADRGVTTAFLTTSLFSSIVQTDPSILSPLRQLLTGGEPIPPDSLRAAMAGLPDTWVICCYGPTEATTFATTFDPTGPEQIGASTPIGRPISNARAYVLDDERQRVPVGVRGELYLGGDGVSRGYLNRPELTEAAFLPSPFEDGTRLYRSGDLARYRRDGNLEFLGRIDRQVKLRGFRIELGEIETVLARQEGVRDAVVELRRDGDTDPRLVGYLLPDGPERPSRSRLRAALIETLPEYMIPAAFVWLEEFPLSPSGKVDRKALPAPFTDSSERERPFVEPRTELERHLAAAWRDVLGVESLSVLDDFFEIGGNSIKAAVLANRIQDEFEIEAPVRTLFYAPTVAQLAMHLSQFVPEVVRGRFGEGPPGSPGGVHAVRHDADRAVRVDVGAIREFRRRVPPLVPDPEPGAPRNRPMLFVLAPPRSGSTLLRVMLEGHPGLVSPPELELLSYRTLGERKKALAGKYAEALDGTIRLLMETDGIGAEDASRLMSELASEDLTTRAFYSRLQERLGGRLLVDKTPSYVFSPEVLRRAEDEFAGARFLHLTRHPYGTVYSFLEARQPEFFFRHPNEFTERQLAELVWTVGHENVLEFLADIPADRQMRVIFEDLVNRPDRVSGEICDFLGLEFEPLMTRPYEGDRMTDPVRTGSQMVGDLKFLLRRRIDPNVAERWRDLHEGDFLGEPTWDLAGRLGYERETATSDAEGSTRPRRLPPLVRIPRDAGLPLSSSQQRLWFLDRMDPGSPLYNIAAGFRIRGRLDAELLELCLGEVVQRHEVLRSNVETVEGDPRVVIRPRLRIPILHEDLGSLPGSVREEDLARRVRDFAGAPFDLGSDALIRARLYRLADEDHVFVLGMHHIVSDGWSLGVLTRELTELYAARTEGRPACLPELPIQYVDYAAWQRESLTAEVMDRETEWWKNALAGLPPRLELPGDRPRTPLGARFGAVVTTFLGPELTSSLKELARAEGATLFMLLLAGFQALLHRYTGQDRIAVGTPVANRNHAELEKLIGFFVNTVVVQGDLSDDPSFLTLLGKVRETTREAYAHQSVPFEAVVDAIAPDRALDQTPLFQVMFTLQNAPMEPVTLPGLSFAPVRHDIGTAKFDLTLDMQERGELLRCTFEYDTGLFDRRTIDRMAEHFRHLLERIVADPRLPVSGLEVMSPRERRLVVREWSSGDDVPFETDVGVQEIVGRLAAADPRAPAVVGPTIGTCGSRGELVELTRGALEERANALAAHLRGLGVGPESRVGLCLERSAEMVVSVLATWKAGGAYVPLDPAYPLERLRFIVEDAGLDAVVTQSDLRSGLPEADRLAVVELDADWERIGAGPRDETGPGAGPGNLAYVIYTSGSTGVPKGVLVEHRSVCNLIAGLRRTVYEKTAGRGLRVGLNAPLVFDASVQQLAALAMGHALYVIPAGARRDPQEFVKFVRDNRLDAIDCVPSHLRLLLAAGLLDDAAWVPSLVLPGGEAIDPALWNRLSSAPHTDFFNMYGPTECTVDSTTVEVGEAGGAPTIGRPLANVRAYVLDAHLEPVPIGVPGEIYIGGPGVARGYLNRPELDRERFLPDPFDRPNGRMYHTGDRARWLASGHLEYLGRLDDQVKVRGFRVELGEIEAVLGAARGVRACAAAVRDDAEGSSRLAAYVVLDRGGEEAAPSIGSLRDWLAGRLPEHMVPSVWVEVEDLPRSTSGKLDRNALPDPEMSRDALGSEYEAPRSPEEETLAAIWSDVLGVDRVGIRDDFFELGGDSILSIRVIARASQAGLKLSPRQMFLTPTVAGLAAAAGSSSHAIDAEQGPVEGTAPLTPVQQRFFSEWDPGRGHWNQSNLLVVDEPLAPTRVRAALESLLAHHDALRLRFRESPEGWVQSFEGPGGPVPFEWEDLSMLDDEASRAEIERRCDIWQGSLDLAEGPVVRVVCFHLGRGRRDRLLFVAHHLVVDAVSWPILLEDFLSAYGQASDGGEIRLPRKTTSYRAWAERIADLASGDGLRESRGYWGHVTERTAPPLPVDRPGGGNAERSAESQEFALAEEITTRLLAGLGAGFGAEMQHAVLASVTHAVSRWTGSRDVWIEVEGHGREALFDDVDLSRTVGWFTALYPVVLTAGDPDDPSGELLTVKEQLRAAARHGLAFGLLRHLGPDQDRRMLSAVPLPEISVNYLGHIDRALPAGGGVELAPESRGRERHPDTARTHRVSVTAWIQGGRLRVRWECSGELHAAETIGWVARECEKRLLGIEMACHGAATSSYTPSDFPEAELSAQEMDAVLVELGEVDDVD